MKIYLKGHYIQIKSRPHQTHLAKYVEKISKHARISFEGGDDPRYRDISFNRPGGNDSVAIDVLLNLLVHGKPGKYKIEIK